MQRSDDEFGLERDGFFDDPELDEALAETPEENAETPAEDPDPVEADAEADADAPEEGENVEATGDAHEDPAGLDPKEFRGLKKVRSQLAAERERVRELQAQIEALSVRQPPTPAPEPSQPQQDIARETPDPVEDPEGFLNHARQMARLEARQEFRAQELLTQERAARAEYGSEQVDAAIEAVKTAPNNKALYASLIEQPDAYAGLMKWHKQQQVLSEIEAAGGVDAWREAQLGATPKPAATAKPSSNVPPPSLAEEAPAKGQASKTFTDDEVFSDIFG